MKELIIQAEYMFRTEPVNAHKIRQNYRSIKVTTTDLLLVGLQGKFGLNSAMRYHVIVLGDAIQVRSKNLTFIHARKMKQRLDRLYPDYRFKAVPSDAWNRIVEYLEKF